ncbi:MAG: hypothetical protein ACQESG_02480 [Nanobdellota archaeon]
MSYTGNCIVCANMCGIKDSIQPVAYSNPHPLYTGPSYTCTVARNYNSAYTSHNFYR